MVVNARFGTAVVVVDVVSAVTVCRRDSAVLPHARAPPVSLDALSDNVYVLQLALAPLRSERTEGGELLECRTEAKRLCNVEQGQLAGSDAVAAGVLRRDLVHALDHLAPAVGRVVGGIDVALHVVPEHAVHDSDGDKHAQHQHGREDDCDYGAALPAPVIAHGACCGRRRTRKLAAAFGCSVWRR